MRRTWWLGVVVAAGLLVACGGGGSQTSGEASGATTTAPSGGASPATSPTTQAGAAPAAATTAAPTTAAPTSAAGAPCQVAYLGDSLGYGTLQNGLGAALAGVNCPMVWSSARPGMEIAEGAAALKAAGDTGTNVVLVSMGYVNTRMHMRNGDFPALIGQVLQAAGDRTVVWPTLGRTSDCTATYVQAIAQANALLAAAKAKAPHLVLIDYPAFIDAHPEYSQHRCPHLTDAGYQARSAWLASQVRSVVDSKG